MPRTGLSADELKDRATDAALARIRLVGFDRVRLTDVARDIGVSHAALYAHFVDKAALLDTVMERWLGKIDAAAQSASTVGGDPRERVGDWFANLYRTKRHRALNDPELYRAFGMAMTGAKPFVAAHLDRVLDQLADILAAVEPALGAEEARCWADLLYEATAAFHHPALVVQATGDDHELRLRVIVRTMLAGIRSAEQN